jgi:hypothetical protein
MVRFKDAWAKSMKAIVFLVMVFGLPPIEAQAMPFGNWTEQKLSLFSGNTWFQSSKGVQVISDGTVSLIWTRLPPSDGGASTAAWIWSMDKSVPATSLSRKGGDDRNLALYFVFMTPERAKENRNANIRKLLKVREARVLMYVWGGNHARQDILPSPYLGARGKTIIHRPAGIGEFRESVETIHGLSTTKKPFWSALPCRLTATIPRPWFTRDCEAFVSTRKLRKSEIVPPKA